MLLLIAIAAGKVLNLLLQATVLVSAPVGEHSQVPKWQLPVFLLGSVLQAIAAVRVLNLILQATVREAPPLGESSLAPKWLLPVLLLNSLLQTTVRAAATVRERSLLSVLILLPALSVLAPPIGR